MTKPEGNGEPRFDLEERTAVFGERVIRFSKRIATGPITVPLISQLVRAGTSVGANYVEADDSSTKKEFLYRIGTCKREARETKYWLRMIVAAENGLKDEARALWQEARELHLIFAAIGRKGRS